MVLSHVEGSHTARLWNVRLGKVTLGYVKGTSGDRLERPELREAESFQIDDDERLPYRPTCGRGRGGEDLGEERLDVHEDCAPVLLGCYVAVEPPGAHRAEALDVHGAAELHIKNQSSQHDRDTRNRQVSYSPYRSIIILECLCRKWNIVSKFCCAPCGNPSASSRTLLRVLGTVSQVR